MLKGFIEDLILVIAKGYMPLFVVTMTCDVIVWQSHISIMEENYLGTHPKFVGESDGGVCAPNHCTICNNYYYVWPLDV